MTDITVTAAKVAGQADTVTRCFKAAATITAGQCVYQCTRVRPEWRRGWR
jgi:hypothetical protein